MEYSVMMIMGRQYRGHKATKTEKIKEATDGVDPAEMVASLQPHFSTPQWEEFVKSHGSYEFQVKIYIIILLFFYKYRCIVFNKFYLLFFVGYQL